MQFKKIKFSKQAKSNNGLLIATMMGLALVGALSGCNSEKTRNVIEERAAQTQQGLLKAHNQQQKDFKRYNPLVKTDKVWAGRLALRMQRGLPLPAKFEKAKGITLVSSQRMSLQDIANAITYQTGIPVRLTGGADSLGGSSSSGKGGGASDITGAVIGYEGTLSGLLENVAGSFGVNWHYNGSAVTINKFETRVFMVEALPGTQSVKEGLQDTQASGGGSSAGSSAAGVSNLSQSNTMNMDFKYWDELGQTLTAMLGGVGNVTLAPSSGSVTVTTTPEVMGTVSQYIATENRRLSRQIAINVEIYSVSLSEGTDFNVAFKTAFNKIAGVNWTGAGAPGSASGLTQAAGQFLIGIVHPKQFGSITGTLSALSSVGDVTEVAQFPLVTLNNRPVARRIGKDTSYVQQVATNQVANAGNTSTVTPGIVNEGFNLQLTPRLLDDGRIILQYSFSLIDLIALKSFGGSTTTASAQPAIQLPETQNRTFIQQSVLKSGSTLILGGVDDEKAVQNANGSGDAFNFLLGGGVSSSLKRSMMVIAITPQVLEPQVSEQD